MNDNFEWIFKGNKDGVESDLKISGKTATVMLGILVVGGVEATLICKGQSGEPA